MREGKGRNGEDKRKGMERRKGKGRGGEEGEFAPLTISGSATAPDCVHEF